MGTVTITAAGFANTPATPPANWPSTLVNYPANGNPNGTKVYTISDADWGRLLTWAAFNSAATFSRTPPALPSPTAAQVLLAWVQAWISASINSERQYNTPAAVIPPPISIA